MFLHQEDKYSSGEDIDKIISVEIPDKNSDPTYYKVVKDFIMDGPCGIARSDSPCIGNGICTRKFPKRYIESTSVDEDSYLTYRRREDSRTIKRSSIALDNRYVVPHNRYLLLKHGAHINVEWCNQSRSITYLFKYVNKGHNCVTTSFY